MFQENITDKKKYKKHKNKDKDRNKCDSKVPSISSNSLTITVNPNNSYVSTSNSINELFQQQNPASSSSLNQNDSDITSSKHHSHHHHCHHHHQHSHHHHHHHPYCSNRNIWNNQDNDNNNQDGKILTNNSPSYQSLSNEISTSPGIGMTTSKKKMDSNETKPQLVKKLESTPVPNQPLKIVLKFQTKGSSSSSNNHTSNAIISTTTNDNNDHTDSTVDDRSYTCTSKTISLAETPVDTSLEPNSVSISLNDIPSSSLLLIPKKLKKSKKVKKAKHKKHSHHHHHHHHHRHHHHHCKKNQQLSPSSSSSNVTSNRDNDERSSIPTTSASIASVIESNTNNNQQGLPDSSSSPIQNESIDQSNFPFSSSSSSSGFTSNTVSQLIPSITIDDDDDDDPNENKNNKSREIYELQSTLAEKTDQNSNNTQQEAISSTTATTTPLFPDDLLITIDSDEDINSFNEDIVNKSPSPQPSPSPLLIIKNLNEKESENKEQQQPNTPLKFKFSKSLENYKIPKLKRSEPSAPPQSQPISSPPLLKLPNNDDQDVPNRTVIDSSNEIIDSPAISSSPAQSTTAAATTTATTTTTTSTAPSKTILKVVKNINEKSTSETSNAFKQLLMFLLKQLQRKDTLDFFAEPVSDKIAPGYSSIITNPMDLSTIKQKIQNNLYRTLGDFKADVKLMCDNCMRYNGPETIYYKTANKLWHYTKQKLFKKDALTSYAKRYSKILPSELSLMPSNQFNLPTIFSKTTTSINMNGNNSNDNSSFGLLKINVDFPINPKTSLSPNFLFPNKYELSPGTRTTATATLNDDHRFVSPDSINSTNHKDNDQISQINFEKFISPVNPDYKNIVHMYNQTVLGGLTPSEMIDSIQEQANKAQKRLWFSGRKYHLSYLEPVIKKKIIKKDQNDDNDEDDDTEDVLLYSIDCQPPLSSSSSVDESQVKLFKRLNLKEIHPPSENGRIPMNVISPSTPFNRNVTNGAAIGIQDNYCSASSTKSKSKTSVEKLEQTTTNTGKNILDEDKKKLIKEEQVSDSDSDSQSDSESEFETKDINVQEKIIKELFDELMPFYGNEIGLEYALSIARFSKNSEYAFCLVSSLLSVLTENEHRKLSSKFYRLMKAKFDDVRSSTTMAAMATSIASTSKIATLDNILQPPE